MPRVKSPTAPTTETKAAEVALEQVLTTAPVVSTAETAGAVTPITTAVEFSAATDRCGQVRSAVVDLQEQRCRLMAPAMETIRRIDAEFRPALDQLDALEKAYKEELVKYAKERQEALCREAEELASQAEKAGKPILAMELRERASGLGPVTLPPSKAVRFSRIYEHVVTDLSLVPREYLKLDSKAINQAIKEGVRHIPGVEIVSSFRPAIYDPQGRSLTKILAQLKMPGAASRRGDDEGEE